MKSWLEVISDSDFSIYNIPFGIAEIGGEKLIVTRLGDKVIVLDMLQDAGVFAELDLPYGIFVADFLNDMIGLGKPITTSIRSAIQKYFTDEAYAQQFGLDAGQYLIDYQLVKMAMPIRVGDYTDFYSSREHATNVGIMFRGLTMP